MKMVFHPHNERGGGEYGWLTTRYSFSFNDWFDPTKMGFGKLRVLNDDVIAEGQGFGAHSHKDMEIITIVTKGAVRHEDSLGNKYVVHEGDVQVMSAGTGVMHSEHNNSASEPLLLFQIWIEPAVRSVPPRYEQKNTSFSSISNEIVELIGSASLSINQDAFVSYGSIEHEKILSYAMHSKSNGVYVFVIEGELLVNSHVLGNRDAIGIWDVDTVIITSHATARFLVIEIPME